jgi:DNA-binding FadR family transcriptional regulator
LTHPPDPSTPSRFEEDVTFAVDFPRALVHGSETNVNQFVDRAQSGPVQRGEALTDHRTRTADEQFAAESEKRGQGVGAISAYLRRAIETGAYSEGDRLPPERQLALTFDAARSTVRRALDQLERAGLVSRRLGSGTYVGASAGPHGADLADRISPLQLVEARLAVEPYTTRLAVLHATRRHLDDMEAVLVRAEGSTEDKDGFSRWDGEFHLMIAQASSNPLLLMVYRQINQVRIHAQWDAMREKILTPDVIVGYNRQHRGIFNALNERDAVVAQALITEHLEKARDDLLRANSP